MRFWGGVCSDYAVTADETGDEVKVKVIERGRRPGQVCIMIAKELTETVTLDKPLGGRKVVDVGRAGESRARQVSGRRRPPRRARGRRDAEGGGPVGGGRRLRRVLRRGGLS